MLVLRNNLFVIRFMQIFNHSRVLGHMMQGTIHVFLMCKKIQVVYCIFLFIQTTLFFQNVAPSRIHVIVRTV